MSTAKADVHAPVPEDHVQPQPTAWLDRILEKNLLPDWLIRIGIRRLLRQRIQDETSDLAEVQQQRFMDLVQRLKASPIAVNTAEANTQHYEVPSEFYQLALGQHLKYSCGYWQAGVQDLSTAEADMLELTCERADLGDNQDILELGCGWGSLSLFAAAKYPNSRYTAVSNSRTQKAFIDEQAKSRGITNLRIITADMNDFTIDAQFDRIVSVEMFEHMRNYETLLNRVARFLRPDGSLFVHIFVHKNFSYLFESKDPSDWMSRYFFTGGIMPSDHLLLYFTDDFQIDQHWHVDGTHYQKTAEAWLTNMDQNRDRIEQLFADTYGKTHMTRWWVYWRVFFMACAELWGYRNGKEWFVSHYRFTKRSQT